MISGPAKSAKRITSLFLGRGDTNNSGEDNSSPDRERAKLNKNKKSPQTTSPQIPYQSPNLRAASVQHLAAPEPSNDRNSAVWRNVSAPLPGDPPKDDQLLPPPSLTAVNPDLQDSSDNHRRRQSWGGNLTSLATNLSRPGSRSSVRPGSRPQTPNTASRLSKGLSWVPGRFASSPVEPLPEKGSMRAWVIGPKSSVSYPYDVERLITGEVVDELWDEGADTYVYLFPKETGKPPSFKIDSALYASSTTLICLARGIDPTSPNWPSRSWGQVSPHGPPQGDVPQLNLPSPAGSPYSPCSPRVGPYDDFNNSDGRTSRDELSDEGRQEYHLYLPVPLAGIVSSDEIDLREEDTDLLVLFRNVFAFLMGQSLVATAKFPTLFKVFAEISGILNRFKFSNLDESTFGEAAHTSFGCYCDELKFVDVRKSREGILNAIVMGEKMRYLPLYHEGYIHGIGRLNEIKAYDASKYSMISIVTQKRMERGYIDLGKRLESVRGRLEDFDFPSLFSGIANSNQINEAKVIRFKNWKNAYMAFKKHVHSHYRKKYGSWPPKANPKKNGFEESGLNRLVLKDLYQDFSDLYDMLADRTSLTTRSADMTTSELGSADWELQESIARALRQVLSEYDRSTPPVQPPIPFDMPQLPNIQSIRRKQLDPKKLRKENAKRLSSGEVNELLIKTCNRHLVKPTPFLADFMDFERSSGNGKSCDDLLDNRCGQWMFMYAVIQALPMVVVDAADAKYTHGVESFMCIPPRGGSPWCQNDSKPSRAWFGVSGGAGVVSLPSDVVTHGVEGIYRRSHCWHMAAKWADEQDMLASAMDHLEMGHNEQPAPEQHPTFLPPLSTTGSSSDRRASSLVTPGNITPPTLHLPVPSPFGRGGNNRASIHMGLEALPLPAGVMPSEHSQRPVSHNPNLSFDQILGQMPKKAKK